MSALVIFCTFSLLNFIHHGGASISSTSTGIISANSASSRTASNRTATSSSTSNTYAFTVNSATSSSSKAPPNNQETALLTFINNVQYPPERLNWNRSQPACFWRGVSCGPDGFTIIYLRLPGMQLSGSIPPNSIEMLTSLRVLSLGDNNLFGPIPSNFSRLTYLTTLSLSNNNFSGNIPSSFSSLFYLTRLILNNNNFSGELPDINSQYLTTFNVSFNKLVGWIPPSLSKFPVSAFYYNVDLCGSPLLAPCNASYKPRTYRVEPDDHSSTWRREEFGIYSGSMTVLLILLSFVGKKMYQHIKPPSELMEKKKLETFDEDGFELEDLLKTTTAEVLGKRSFGTSYKQVFEGKDKTVKTVVVKILKDVLVTEKELKKKMKDLGEIKNNYVVPLRAFCNYSGHEKLLVYDYMSGGSLFARLRGSARTKLDWDHRMQIALSAAKGLTYLHVDKKIVHGNITSSNVFLQETSNEVSLSDCSLNTLFRGSSSLDDDITCYWAPEVLKTRDFTFESDVYSYGVLLLELLTGKNQLASLNKEGAHLSEWVGSVCEEPKAEVFDLELVRDHNIKKMVQLLLIAKDCLLIAHDRRPLISIVVRRMEKMLLSQSSD